MLRGRIQKSAIGILLILVFGGAALTGLIYYRTVKGQDKTAAAATAENTTRPAAIQARGSGSLMPLMQKVTEKLMAQSDDVTLVISGGGSNRGLKSLIDGTCEIALSSIPIGGDLQLLADERGVELVAHVVAYDAIVPYVSLDNPLDSLTVRQLRDIYTARISNWQDLGGLDQPIDLTTRNLNSGTFEGWRLMVLGQQSVVSPTAQPMESQAMLAYVREHPAAIGFSALSYLDDSVKPLQVEGVAANRQSIVTHRYPLRRELYLYTRKDTSEQILALISQVQDQVPELADQLGIFPAN